jgi:hypothetical protein
VKDPNYKPRGTIAIGGKKSKKQKHNETRQQANSVMQMVEAKLKRALQGDDSSDDDGDQKPRKKKSRGKGKLVLILVLRTTSETTSHGSAASPEAAVETVLCTTCLKSFEMRRPDCQSPIRRGSASPTAIRELPPSRQRRRAAREGGYINEQPVGLQDTKPALAPPFQGWDVS